MYAVIKTGGKQYRVQPGDLLVVEKLEAGEPGSEVSFDQVLMVGGAAGGADGPPRGAGAVGPAPRRVTGPTGAGAEVRGDGEVDLTPRSTLRERARNLGVRADAPIPADHALVAEDA